MEKYEAHGLTRAEDDILGGFGNVTDIEYDSIKDESITPEQRRVIKQMIHKGLIESHLLEDLALEFRLTLKGRKLFSIRSEEEEAGPTMSDKAYHDMKTQHVKDTFT